MILLIRFFLSLSAIAAVATLGFATGCVIGPRVEKKSALDALNGETYSTAAEVATTSVAFPILIEHERPTSVHGQVLFRSGGVEIPLKMIRIEVRREANDPKSVLAWSSTDEVGQFKIKAPILNGTYQLVAVSSRYIGSTALEVSKYKVEGILLRVTER